MITIDDTQFPVLLIRSHDIQPGEAVGTVETIGQYAARAKGLNTKIALIVFEGDMVDAQSRKDMAQKVKALPEIEAYVEISIVIVNSSFKRGALTALLWLIGTKPPTRAVSDVQSALAVLKTSSVVAPAGCTLEFLRGFGARGP
jgi:hypothetical protein